MDMEVIENGLSFYRFGAWSIWGVSEPAWNSSPTTRPPHFEVLIKRGQRMGLSLEDAEDAVQEAFLRLHLYRRTRVVSSEGLFLRRVVYNLVIDHFRRSNRQLSMSDLKVELISDAPGPERTVGAAEALSELRLVIGKYVLGTEQMLVAHEAGWTCAEIARDMLISVITVKRRLARARALLSSLKKQRPWPSPEDYP